MIQRDRRSLRGSRGAAIPRDGWYRRRKPSPIHGVQSRQKRRAARLCGGAFREASGWTRSFAAAAREHQQLFPPGFHHSLYGKDTGARFLPAGRCRCPDATEEAWRDDTDSTRTKSLLQDAARSLTRAQAAAESIGAPLSDAFPGAGANRVPTRLPWYRTYTGAAMRGRRE